MRVRLKVGFIVASLALLAVAVPACGDPNAFQPITYGAKRWTPPPGWAPGMQCAVGYFVAIDSCTGCTGISYALCTGVDFNQCVCGSPFTPGAICPNQCHCAADDFPPQNWLEFSDYTGPGQAAGHVAACSSPPASNPMDAGAGNPPEGGASGEGGGD